MKTKNFVLALCCLLTATALFSQNAGVGTDSMRQIIQLQNGDKKARSFLHLSRYYIIEHPDSSLFYINKALESAVSPVAKGDVYWEKTLFFDHKENIVGLTLALDSAIGFYENSNDSLLAMALRFKNILKADAGLYREALQLGHKELELRQQLSSADEELNAILQIGYTYDRMGDYSKAIEWYNKGFLVEGVTNNDYIGRNYGLIGIAYDELKDYDKAVFYNLKAIDYFLSVPESIFLHSWYSNLGNSYTKMGKLDLAKRYTLLALQDKRRVRYSSMINLGKIYIEQGKFDQAEQTLNEVIGRLEKIDQKIFLSEAYYRMYELFKKKRDFQTSLSYLEKYKSVEDARINENKLKHLNELTIQYETLEKEKKILEQSALIAANKMRIRKRTQWMIGLSSVFILLSVIGLLLYKQQRLKTEKVHNENELKMALVEIDNRNKLQNQRLSISRNLHDNIGAHLTFIISSIDTVRQVFAREDVALNNKLMKLRDFTHDTIQELRDTIWVMNKGELDIKDLKLRITNFVGAANDNTHELVLTFRDYLPQNSTLQFDSKTGMNIYRILQEAVANAIKHSEANKINISFDREGESLLIRIEDNGKGFDLSEVKIGNGISNMRNRALSIKGNLSIESSPGRTSVICTLPIKNLNNAANS